MNYISIIQSKNSTSVQLNSRFSKHIVNHSTQDEGIKVDETALDSGSEKSYIAGLLENDENWHAPTTYNWILNEFSHSQESLYNPSYL